MSQREKRVPVYATIRDSLTDVLDELAVDMRTDPQGALNCLLEAALGNDAACARMFMGVVTRRAEKLGAAS
jgi:hypothetical protein